MEFLKEADVLVGIIALLALGVATYVNLTMRPLRERVETNTERLLNYGEFKGKVEALLDVNVQDHKEIKRTLEIIRSRLEEIYKTVNGK